MGTIVGSPPGERGGGRTRAVPGFGSGGRAAISGAMLGGGRITPAALVELLARGTLDLPILPAQRGIPGSDRAGPWISRPCDIAHEPRETIKAPTLSTRASPTIGSTPTNPWLPIRGRSRFAHGLHPERQEYAPHRRRVLLAAGRDKAARGGLAAQSGSAIAGLTRRRFPADHCPLSQARMGRPRRTRSSPNMAASARCAGPRSKSLQQERLRPSWKDGPRIRRPERP